MLYIIMLYIPSIHCILVIINSCSVDLIVTCILLLLLFLIISLLSHHYNTTFFLSLLYHHHMYVVCSTWERHFDCLIRLSIFSTLYLLFIMQNIHKHLLWQTLIDLTLILMYYTTGTSCSSDRFLVGKKKDIFFVFESANLIHRSLKILKTKNIRFLIPNSIYAQKH